MVNEGVCAIFQDEETPNKGGCIEEDIVEVHHWELCFSSQGLDSVVELVSPGANIAVSGN